MPPGLKFYDIINGILVFFKSLSTDKNFFFRGESVNGRVLCVKNKLPQDIGLADDNGKMVFCNDSPVSN